MSAIQKARLEVTTVSDLITREDTVKALAITFDDGFVNFRDQAWPLLKDSGFPVLLFVATDHVGHSNTWSNPPRLEIPVLPLLDWEMLAALGEEGVELGSHSRTHRDLRGLSDLELEDEMFGAAEKIKKMTGVTPRIFAYPYGATDARAAAVAARAYDLACTTELRHLRTSDQPNLLPRLDTWYLRPPSFFKWWGSSPLRAYLRLRARVRGLRPSF